MSIMKKRQLYRILGLITILGVTAVWAFNILTKQKYRLNRRNIQMIEKEYKFEDVYFGRMKARLPKDVGSFIRGYALDDIYINSFPWPENEADLSHKESAYYQKFSQKDDGIARQPHDSVKILAAPKRNEYGYPRERPPQEPLDLTSKIGFLGYNGGRFNPEPDKYFVQKPNILPRDALYDAVFKDHVQREILKKDNTDDLPLILQEHTCFNDRVKIIYFYEDAKNKDQLYAHALLHLDNGDGLWIATIIGHSYRKLSLTNLENVLKEIIKNLVDIREEIIFADDARHYFFMGNNALILPFNTSEFLELSISQHKLFEYLDIDTSYGAGNTYDKRFLLDQLHSRSNYEMAMGLGLSLQILRDGLRTVSGIEGQEILLKATEYKSKISHINFSWQYLGDPEHQAIDIEMELPENFPEKDLPMSIAMWDYILNSIVWFEKK